MVKMLDTFFLKSIGRTTELILGLGFFHKLLIESRPKSNSTQIFRFTKNKFD